jgi:hypothetical protein
MKKSSVPILIAFVFVFVFVFVVNAFAQKQEPITRPRTVTPGPVKQLAKAQIRTQEPQNPARTTETEKKAPAQQPTLARESASSRLSPNKIHQRIEEAERMLKTRPHPTALATPPIDTVTVAAMLPDNSHIHLFHISKELFLTKGSEIPAISMQGLPATIRVIRANGVNTAVTIFDEKNRSLMPLVVEYPIERRGVFREMAYYTSAHPALLSNDLTKSGQVYVNSMVDLAAKRLKDKGFPVAANLVEIAKRLCIH